MLRIWLKAIEAAHHPEVQHFVIVVDEPVPLFEVPGVRFICCEGGDGHARQSIGYFHNIAAILANSEWIMKLDVDALPHYQFFSALLPVLRAAKEREWFNVGMFYVKPISSFDLIGLDKNPVSIGAYLEITRNLVQHSASHYHKPAASNFVCRREDYLRVGGCDRRFRGYGWEDYQQIFMLEKQQQGCDPLPGTIDFANVTQRCREEISHRKADELYRRNPFLALLHYWHPPSCDPSYRSKYISRLNRQVLLDNVMKARA